MHYRGRTKPLEAPICGAGPENLTSTIRHRGLMSTLRNETGCTVKQLTDRSKNVLSCKKQVESQVASFCGACTLTWQQRGAKPPCGIPDRDSMLTCFERKLSGGACWPKVKLRM